MEAVLEAVVAAVLGAAVALEVAAVILGGVTVRHRATNMPKV